MKRSTVLKLYKIASGIYGEGAPLGAEYLDTFTKEFYIPKGNVKQGDEREVANTVSDVLRNNYMAMAELANHPEAKDFAVSNTRWPLSKLIPIKSRPISLPKEIQDASTWACMQGLSLMSPGMPFYVKDYGRHATTRELITALRENKRIPINPKFALYVLDDKLARDIDYNLPGSLHLAEWPNGSGHMVMNGGRDYVYEFHEPGLERRPAYQTDPKQANQVLHLPWFRESEAEMYAANHPSIYYYRSNNGMQPTFTDVQMMMTMPTSISPEQVAGQLYDLILKQDAFKGRKDIIARDAYIKQFLDANDKRVEGGHYMLPTFVKNSGEVPRLSPMSMPEFIKKYLVFKNMRGNR